MLKKSSLLICITVMVICIDQIAKIYIHTNFSLHETHSLIQNFLNVTYVRNFGAAFGLLESSHLTLRNIFMFSVPPMICTLILVLIYYVRSENAEQFKNNLMQLLSLSLIFAGAIGNYFDRLHYGYVIDFIDVHWNQQLHFPTFNFADCAIVIGVFFLIISVAREKQHVSAD